MWSALLLDFLEVSAGRNFSELLEAEQMLKVMSQEIFAMSGQALRQVCSAWRVTDERGRNTWMLALYSIGENRMESDST